MDTRIKISSLPLREAVADALYRCVLGLDCNDWDMFRSSLAEGEDISMELKGSISIKGPDQIKQFIFDFIGPLDTTHHISNIRVDVKDGDDTATLSANAVAQHYREGEGPDPTTAHLMTGSIYVLDLVKDGKDDLWKIKKWSAKIVWRDGDRSIIDRGLSAAQN
ncbi:hypothetical protein LTS07_010855 [Exophiala sideris]|uniref:SnoaL-like domain-containing protein n=1 Tax=Exophiala sideris TaxID=1016849 RepID=A0ABR0IVR6_9EURO|nr:hypothetical protein LTS07_010855 [Exophiala sideris]KAK5024810.1 hypothetical protein LTR13_010779 [Exophiala sideris]KAK5049695.1 hypothetical protein LTR69_010879 [Exophiala sideris]KAK5176676.1 hypothetical protein LTR44_010746 [Eurotiomycetes sp. CCFEE 6388]